MNINDLRNTPHNLCVNHRKNLQGLFRRTQENACISLDFLNVLLHDKWVYHAGILIENAGYCFHRALFIRTSQTSHEKVRIFIHNVIKVCLLLFIIRLIFK